MKRIKKFAGILVLTLIMIFASSCSAEEILNLNSSSSKTYDAEFYKNNGYYELSVCESLSYNLDENNIIEFDGVTLIKGGTKICFTKSYEIENVSSSILDDSFSNFDFENRKILAGYNIGNDFYDTLEVDNLEYIINSDTVVTEEIKGFEILGFVIYNESEKNENTETFLNSEQEYLSSIMFDENGNFSSADDDYLFYYFAESEEEFENNENIIKNFSKSSVSERASYMMLNLEAPVDNVINHVFIIAKDEDNSYYFIKLATSEDDSICTESSTNDAKSLTFDFRSICDSLNLFKIKLVLCSDLTTTNVYTK